MLKRIAAAAILSAASFSASAEQMGFEYLELSDLEIQRECLFRQNLLTQVINLVRSGAQPGDDVDVFVANHSVLPREWVNQSREAGFTRKRFYDAYHGSDLLVLYIERFGPQHYVDKCIQRPDVFFGDMLNNSPILDHDAIPEDRREVDRILIERGYY